MGLRGGFCWILLRRMGVGGRNVVLCGDRFSNDDDGGEM